MLALLPSAGCLQVVNHHPDLSPAYFFAGTPPFFSVQDNKGPPLQAYLDGFQLSLLPETGNQILQLLDMAYTPGVWTNRVHKDFTFFYHNFFTFNCLLASNAIPVAVFKKLIFPVQSRQGIGRVTYPEKKIFNEEHSFHRKIPGYIC